MNANKMLCKSRFFIFDANAFFTRMQMRNAHMMHMSLFRDAIFMMQMSPAGVQMQSLSMMVLARIFNRDEMFPCRDENAKILWCKCLLMGMS